MKKRILVYCFLTLACVCFTVCGNLIIKKWSDKPKSGPDSEETIKIITETIYPELTYEDILKNVTIVSVEYISFSDRTDHYNRDAPYNYRTIDEFKEGNNDRVISIKARAFVKGLRAYP